MGNKMNRLQVEIFNRKLACGTSIGCKRSAKVSARNILQYGKAAVDAFNDFSTPEKTTSSKLKESAIADMNLRLSSVKMDIRRMVRMRNKGMSKPLSSIYIARARRINNGISPFDSNEALNIVIKEHIGYARSVIISARQSRIAASECCFP